MTPKPKYDVALIGGGIMSATLAALLHQLDPTLDIAVFERLHEVAQESSAPLNNAGTGHSAFCELNYTPQQPDGSIDISKAVKICEQFEISKQFWSFLLDQGLINCPKDFITSCPHMSLVFGEEDARYLKSRYDALQQSHLFHGMEFSENAAVLEQWMPLIMNGRDGNGKLAATRMEMGTDVNFGQLTAKIFNALDDAPKVEVFRYHDVKDIDPNGANWRLYINDREDNHQNEVVADFVFIGAGGYALPLLDSSDIDESEGYGGFPVSGQWLVTRNPKLIAQHRAKVYTQASVDAPPMSVPHLDLRYIDGEEALLFGPFAGFSTKFLKKGTFLDLPKSINFKNIRSLFGAWWHNLELTQYLIEQILLNKEERLGELRRFVKNAHEDDWELVVAGQRVQIIKKDPVYGGRLEFGTEVVVNKRGNIASLLGASPGASTSVSAMLTVLEKCFPQRMETEWRDKIREMIPSYGQSLAKDAALTEKVRTYTKEKLQLDY